MRKKKSEKGLQAIKALVVVAFVSLIGGAAWYVWQSRNNNQQVTTQASETARQESSQKGGKQPATDETANWKLITSGQGRFRFRASDGWKFINCAETDWIYVRYENDMNDTALDYQQSAPVAEVQSQCGGFGDILKFSIAQYNADGSSNNRGTRAPDPVVNGIAITTAQGAEGQKKCDETKYSPYDDAPAILKSCEYFFTSSKSQIWADYQLVEGDKDRTALIEKVVKSIEFD